MVTHAILTDFNFRDTLNWMARKSFSEDVRLTRKRQPFKRQREESYGQRMLLAQRLKEEREEANLSRAVGERSSPRMIWRVRRSHIA